MWSFLLLKNIIYDKIIIGDSMNDQIDTEFTDIEKESKYKNYIIVIILYIIVIMLSILLIYGIKNQKDELKDNINNEKNIEVNR